MSEDPKPKVGGIAAIGAAFAALMMKGGMACGSALSHVPASVADDAVRVAAPLAHGADSVADDAVRAVGNAGSTAASEGGANLVERAGETAARRSARVASDSERITKAAETVARQEIRRRQREERERERERREQAARKNAR